MKKFIAVICTFVASYSLVAQGIIYENNFNGYANYQHFPKDGWIEEGVENANWQFTGHLENYAGGEDSELLHYGSSMSPFTGMTRAVSPVIDMSGHSSVKFNFLYGGKFWSPGFEIGVATRSNGGDWTVVWSHTNTTQVSGLTGSHEVNVVVNNSDIGQSNFQFCFFFDGTNTDCQFLCFDNFVISEILSNDIKTSEISIPTQVLAGNPITVEGTYYNNGTAEETCEAILNIYDWNDNLIYNDTETISQLASSTETTVTFDPFTVPDADALYSVEITHNLPNDLNTNNDIQTGIFNSYSTERQMVLLEIGTATWCSGCPGAALAAEDFVANGDDVAVIEYHGNDDYSTGNVTTRFGVDYYNSYSFPTSVFDGTIKHFGGHSTQSIYDEVLPIYEERKAINSPLSLSISGAPTSSHAYDINIDIERIAPVLDNDYSVYLALTESEIEESWMGGLEELNFVERALWPDVYGRSIDLMNNTNLTESFSVSFVDSIVTEHCEFIAFVQNMNTLEILQATKISLPELGSTAPTVSHNYDEGATNVPANAYFEITFNQAVRNIDNSEITSSDIQDLVSFKNASGETISFAGEINEEKTKITVTPSQNLAFETTFSISISNVENAFDIAIEESTLTFTTETTPSAPTATFNIEDGATDIAINTDVITSFNQPVRNIDGSEITSNDITNIISLKNSSNEPVEFSGSINDTKTVITITPNTPLEYETLYHLSVSNVENEFDIALEETSIEFTTSPSAINEISALDIKLYPNPTHGIITLDADEKNVELKVNILSISGELIREFNCMSSNTNNFDLTSLPKGMYFVQIQAKNKKSKMQKIVLN